MTMKKLITGFLLIILTMKAFAGSGTAILTCESESGKTKFIAYLQDIDGIINSAEFTINNSTIEFTSDEKGYTIFDPKNGVFTIYIEGKTNETYQNHKYIQFWAIPSTFKIIKNERSHQIYEFKAIIYGTEPRPDKEMHCPEIELNCKLEYKI